MSPESVQKAEEAITENGISALVEGGEDDRPPEESELKNEESEAVASETAETHKTGEIHTV